MRSIVVKNGSLDQCGICKEKGYWIKEMDIDGTHFLYCSKCNTITFTNDIDSMTQQKIENRMNIYYHKIQEEKK